MGIIKYKMKVTFGAMMLLLSNNNEVDCVRVNSLTNNRAKASDDAWTDERLGNSNSTSWVDSSPMAAYGRVDMSNFVQLSNETSWYDNDYHGPSEASLAQIKSKARYDHWTEKRLDDSNATTWIDSSPMAAYGRVPLDDYV